VLPSNRRLAGRAALALGLLVGARESAAQASPSPEVLAAVSQSIVRLGILEGGEEQGNGTGFVVEPDGVVVTNHHVVDGVESALIAVLHDGTKRRVLGSLALDPEHDLALVRLEPGTYKALPLATAYEIRVGQPVFLLGSSAGLDQSLGTGVVAALRLDGFPEEWKKRYEQMGRKVVAGPILQHTAASSPGSSGSPVVDLSGNVVAVHHSGVYGFPVYFGAHVDALRDLLARTDLAAAPKPFGTTVARNLLTSAAVLAVLAALFGAPAAWRHVSQLRRGGLRPPGWPR
jgi:S1-C subfamily serine protease